MNKNRYETKLAELCYHLEKCDGSRKIETIKKNFDHLMSKIPDNEMNSIYYEYQIEFDEMYKIMDAKFSSVV
jgi:hypothetical protein